MRIDKYLQVSRIIKRRSVAKEIIEKNRISINDKIAKPGSQVNIEDIIIIEFGDVKLKFKVLMLDEKVKKEEAENLYEIISKE